MTYEVKVYIVQDQEGRIVGAKLTREAAQSVARLHAPASVVPIWCDKSPPRKHLTNLLGCALQQMPKWAKGLLAMRSVLKKSLLLVAGLAAVAGYFSLLERHPPIGKPVVDQASTTLAARAEEPVPSKFELGKGILEKGAVFCLSYSGLNSASSGMNASQLESLGCTKVGRVVEISVPADSWTSAYVTASIVLPDKVVRGWARNGNSGMHSPAAKFCPPHCS